MGGRGEVETGSIDIYSGVYFSLSAGHGRERRKQGLEAQA